MRAHAAHRGQREEQCQHPPVPYRVKRERHGASVPELHGADADANGQDNGAVDEQDGRGADPATYSMLDGQ
jgi:hypothetical protein